MIDGVWLALRAAGLVLLFQAAGAVLFLESTPLSLAGVVPVRRRAERVALCALPVLAAQLLVEPAHLAGEWSGLGDLSLWRLALVRVGPAIDARLAGLALVAFGLRAAGPRARWLALGGSLVALGSLVPGGHAALSPFAPLLFALLGLHVLVGSFWFGSLVPLADATRLLPARELSLVLAAFSRHALWLVPLIGASGVAVACLLLPAPGVLLEPYGLLLCGKAALYALLLALASLNRWRFTPALARGEEGARGPLGRSIACEYVLIALVLVLTALLTGFFSPR
jgi:putative copper export protein